MLTILEIGIVMTANCRRSSVHHDCTQIVKLTIEMHGLIQSNPSFQCTLQDRNILQILHLTFAKNLDKNDTFHHRNTYEIPVKFLKNNHFDRFRSFSPYVYVSNSSKNLQFSNSLQEHSRRYIASMKKIAKYCDFCRKFQRNMLLQRRALGGVYIPRGYIQGPAIPRNRGRFPIIQKLEKSRIEIGNRNRQPRTA